MHCGQDHQRIRARAFIISCVSIILVGTAGLVFPLWNGDEKPQSGNTKITQHIEMYVHEHFGMRRYYIQLGNILSLLVFHQGKTSQVVFGKNGWLFYSDPGTDSHKIFTEEELEQWKAYLEGRFSYFGRHGIQYAFLVIPDKQTIYPEYFPGVVVPGARLEQLDAYLRKYFSVRILHPTEALRYTKEQMPMYLMYDTHWTRAGAFIAYRALAQELGVRPMEFSQVSLEERWASADILGILGLGWLPRHELEAAYRVRSPKARIVERSPDLFVHGARLIYTVSNTRLPRCLVYHDSFFDKMMGFFAEHCANTVYIRKDPNAGSAISREDIVQVRPDIVIEETIERKLPVLPVLDAWMEEENAQ